MADIRITPGSSIMSFTSSLNFTERITQDASGSLNLYGSGSTGRTELFSVDGNNGRLFTVSDDLSDSLFSVNTIAGLPVIEAFADNTVTMGQYGQNVLKVTGSSVVLGKPTSDSYRLDVKGSGSLGALQIQKSTGGYLLEGKDGDGYTMIRIGGDIANTNMNIALGDVDGGYTQPTLLINSSYSYFKNTNLGVDVATPTRKLEVAGSVGLRASALGSAATQILVTSADPSSTTRTVQTRTPAELRSDIGAGTGNGTVTSIATNNGVTGGTITSTGTIGLATAYGDTINPYGSKTANTFLAAPNGSAGTPSFRAIVAADVPTLNQNTTGTATNATNAANIAITNDTTTNATYYPVFVSTTSGNTAARVDSSTLTYNPNTNTLVAGTFSGNFSGGTVSLSSLHSIYNYISSLIIQASSGTTISLGGGPGNVQNNVQVANGYLTLNGGMNYNPSISTSNTNGEVAYWGGGSVTAGNLYYYDSSGNWTAADADTDVASQGMLGIALATGTASTVGILLRGHARFTANSNYTAVTTIGAKLYVSATAGGFTQTAPSTSGQTVRIIGYVQSTTNDQIYFCPDTTWVKLA